MASYEDIRAYFDESALLKEVVRNAARVPIVTGFTLDIDPLWSHLYDIENNLVDSTHVPWGALCRLRAACRSSLVIEVIAAAIFISPYLCGKTRLK